MRVFDQSDREGLDSNHTPDGPDRGTRAYVDVCERWKTRIKLLPTEELVRRWRLTQLHEVSKACVRYLDNVSPFSIIKDGRRSDINVAVCSFSWASSSLEVKLRIPNDTWIGAYKPLCKLDCSFDPSCEPLFTISHIPTTNISIVLHLSSLIHLPLGLESYTLCRHCQIQSWSWCVLVQSTCIL